MPTTLKLGGRLRIGGLPRADRVVRRMMFRASADGTGRARGDGCAMAGPSPAAVALYWIPLGSGGHVVAFNGRVFEAVAAARQHRPRCALYHAALVVDCDGDRYTIELAPTCWLVSAAPQAAARREPNLVAVHPDAAGAIA